MNNKLKKRIIQTSYNLINLPNSNQKHFSYIVDGNKILSVGVNNSWKTHTLAKKYQHRFSCIHSEISAIIRYQYQEEYLSRCKIINVRINKAGEICLAKPCKKCMPVLESIGFKEVWFTNNYKEFEKLA